MFSSLFFPGLRRPPGIERAPGPVSATAASTTSDSKLNSAATPLAGSSLRLSTYFPFLKKSPSSGCLQQDAMGELDEPVEENVLTKGATLPSDPSLQNILHVIERTPSLQNEVTDANDASPLAASSIAIGPESLEPQGTETFLSIRGGVIHPLGLPAPTTYAEVAELAVLCPHLVKQLLALRLVPEDTAVPNGARTVSFEIPDSSMVPHLDPNGLPDGEVDALPQVAVKIKKKKKRCSRGRARARRKPVDPDAEKEGEEAGLKGVDDGDAEEAERSECEDGPSLLIPRSDPLRAWSEPPEPKAKVPRSAFHLAQVDALVKELHKTCLEDASSRPSSRNQNETEAVLPATPPEISEPNVLDSSPDVLVPDTESPPHPAASTSEDTGIAFDLPTEVEAEEGNPEDECIQSVDEPIPTAVIMEDEVQNREPAPELATSQDSTPEMQSVDEPTPTVICVEEEIQDREPTPELASAQDSTPEMEISPQQTPLLAVESAALVSESLHPCSELSQDILSQGSQEICPQDAVSGSGSGNEAQLVADMPGPGDGPRGEELESKPMMIATFEQTPRPHRPPRTRKPRLLGRPRIPTPAPTYMTGSIPPQVSNPIIAGGTARPSWLARPSGSSVHLRLAAMGESPHVRPEPQPKLFGNLPPSPALLLVPPQVVSPVAPPEIDSGLDRRPPASPPSPPKKPTVRHLWTSGPAEDLPTVQDNLLPLMGASESRPVYASTWLRGQVPVKGETKIHEGKMGCTKMGMGNGNGQRQ